MMLFRLAYKNIKKSLKDYAIYFCTLILGVTIFYVFNALEKQTAMLEISNSAYYIVKSFNKILSYISIFISVVLGILIVYASNFLIKRRKKEFGIYMLVGMSKRKIAIILFGETIIIGALSLMVGIGIGIVASQGMSMIVADMFESDMTKFEFVISSQAIVKTIINFVVMYIVVMLLDMIVVGKSKLINLINANKKAEYKTNKNPIVCTIIGIISIIVLIYFYYMTMHKVNGVIKNQDIIKILLGIIIATFLIFWSFSGLLLFLTKSNKGFYLKKLNCFTSKEISSKINTTVVLATIICVMMTFTICMLSIGLELKSSYNENLKRYVSKDACLIYDRNTDVKQKISKEESKGFYDVTKDEIQEKMQEFDESDVDTILEETNTSDIFNQEANVWTYEDKELTDEINKILQQYNSFLSAKEEIICLSDYNKVAKAYNLPNYALEDNECIVICEVSEFKEMLDKGLKTKTEISIAGKKYKLKYDSCKEGFLQMGVEDYEIGHGFVIVPDITKEDLNIKSKNYVVASYNKDYKFPSTYKSLEDYVDGFNVKGEYDFDIFEVEGHKYEEMKIRTKKGLYDKSIGTAVFITFCIMYVGIVFLISSAAVLSLKILSSSADNAYKYNILRKIGVSEKILNKSLLKQNIIFFILPMILAIVHSIFGIKFCRIRLINANETINISFVITCAIIILGIYLIYFIITHLTSKKIISEKVD